jgi:hypothetical protein
VLSAGKAAAMEVEIYDRASQQILPTYRYHGRTYVAGEPGHEYEVRIRNPNGKRVLAVTTVDGVNVVSGQTGATNQAGYVLDAYGYASIEGWRKDLSHTAAFYFTSLANSYAARTGRPDNVGVIGIAAFYEKDRCCEYRSEDDRVSDGAMPRRESAPSAAAAPSVLGSADSASNRQDADSMAKSKLGTGHGRREYSAAQYTEFERASNSPNEIVAIYYDSRRNLVAQGIIPREIRYGSRLPQPFPSGFVMDP